MSLTPDNTPLNDLTATLEPPKSSKDEAFATLERENAELRDAIKEERFCWILLSIILFDMSVFSTVSTTGVPLAILGLELLFIIVIAKKHGVQQVILFVDRVIDGLIRRSSGS